MTRIIYGFSGEGSGHSSRASEMARFLIQSGHQIRLASYDRGYENLKDEFEVTEIEGLSIASSDNRVSKLATIRENLKKLPAGKRSIDRLRKLFTEFKPDVVICDFEPMTAYLAEHYEVPLISLDNQHRMRYVKHSIPPGKETQAAFTRSLIRAMVPWPSVSLIVALRDEEKTNDRSFIFPPIVKKEVRESEATIGSHTLVYLTSGFDSLLPFLKQFPNEEFRIYGYDRIEQDGKLQFLKNSKDGFVADLASSKAVIATAGFTLISEAAYLRKPYFALPMQGQYEQELNAWQLQEFGFGMTAEPVTEQALRNFYDQLEAIRDNLQSYSRDDGSLLKTKLGELVANDAALARDFRNRRSR